VERIVGEESFYRILRGEDFPEVKGKDSFLFDFGGFPEPRAYSFICFGLFGSSRVPVELSPFPEKLMNQAFHRF
jgi:hypothetical protein